VRLLVPSRNWALPRGSARSSRSSGARCSHQPLGCSWNAASAHSASGSGADCAAYSRHTPPYCLNPWSRDTWRANRQGSQAGGCRDQSASTPLGLAHPGWAPPARFELALPPPEGGALSPELRGPGQARGRDLAIGPKGNVPAWLPAPSLHLFVDAFLVLFSTSCRAVAVAYAPRRRLS
jgi:hypothetical protein